MFRWLLHLSIILVVTALVANYYANNGAGYGVTIPPYVYYGVLGLVTVVPVFWAITHLCGGLLMGIASGGACISQRPSQNLTAENGWDVARYCGHITSDMILRRASGSDSFCSCSINAARRSPSAFIFGSSDICSCGFGAVTG